MGEEIVSVEGWGEMGSGGVLDDEGEVEGGHEWGEGVSEGGRERLREV